MLVSEWVTSPVRSILKIADSIWHVNSILTAADSFLNDSFNS